jgi:DTW domain-containing protein YfiP
MIALVVAGYFVAQCQACNKKHAFCVCVFSLSGVVNVPRRQGQ